jgi:hypothetical protein
MTQSELKELKAIGAELGAAKAEVERMREVLSRIANLPMYHCSTENDYRLSAAKAMAVAALSQQAEPVRCPGTEDTASMDSDSAQEQYTAVDMATAAAQGFRDGQAAVEPAAAQGEQPSVFWVLFDATGPERFIKKDVSDGTLAFFDSEDEAQRAKRRHPGTDYKRVEYYRAPIAQTAPQGKFRMGDLVKKTSGSEWVGRICGTYSTALTPEGYAVESEAHAGSVQIYPAKALEAVE